MSVYTVIRDVSNTLQNVLQTNFIASSTFEVTLQSPQNVSSSLQHYINLYLYHVTENGFAKTREALRRGSSQMQRAPLALNLYYMLTPYTQATTAGSTLASNIEEHLILGDAMRILYDNSTLDDSVLMGDLRGRNEEFTISLCRMNLEEQTRIWNALQISYRLSVCYEARIALIDSQDVVGVRRVETQINEYNEL